MTGLQTIDAVMETLAESVPPGDEGGPLTEMLRLAIEQMQAAARSAPMFVPVMVPMAIGDLVGLRPADRRLLAAACASLWRGADLLDDLADGDAKEPWRAMDPALVTLVATNLLSNLPHLLLGRLASRGVAPDLVLSLHQAVSRALVVMSAGQYRDVLRQTATHADYLAVVRAKSGAEIALFAELPALLAGLEPPRVAGWRVVGEHLGVMAQVYSDVVALAHAGPDSDIAQGRLTRAALVALDLAGPQDAAALREDLSRAGDDPAALARARARIGRADVLRRSLVLVELMRHRAAAALPVPLSGVPAGHPLRTLLSSWALVPVNLPGGTPDV